MADERQLNVTTRLDASGVRAGMAEAAQAIDQGAAQMKASFASAAEASAALKDAQGEMAAILSAVGGTIDQNNAAWGIYAAAEQRAAEASEYLAAAAKDASAAVEAMAASQGNATSSATALGGAESYASARIAAAAAGVGQMGYALGSVARNSTVLGPILQGLFPVLAAGAFADIIWHIADGVKNWYDNAVLLKQLNADLLTASEGAARAAAARNWEYVESLIGVQKAMGKDAEAVETLRSRIGEKPLNIELNLKDADLKQAEGVLGGISQLIGRISGSNTLGTGESLVGPITAQIDAARRKYQQLTDELNRVTAAEEEQKRLAESGAPIAAVAGIPPGGSAKLAAQAEAVKTSIQALQDALGQINSAKGTAGDTIWAQQETAAKDSAAVQEGVAKALLGVLEANADRERQLVADSMAQSARHAAAEAREQEAAARGAARYADDAIKHAKDVATAQKVAAKDAADAAKIALDGQRQHAEAIAELSVRAIQAQARAKLITARQEASELDEVYEREHKSLVDSLNAELAALDQHASNYLAEKQRILNEIRQADDRLAQQKQGASEAAGKGAGAGLGAEVTAKAITTVGQSFSRVMDGVMQGTQRFSVAWRHMCADLVAGWASAMVQVLAKNLAMEVTRTAQHAAAKQSQVGIDASTAAESDAISSASAMKQISHDAAKAATGAYKAVVGIPYIGPILAPPAAGAAYAGVIAWGALASAEGGQWQVPGAEQLTMLHRDEMVLPAIHAEGLRNLVQGGGGGNAVHVHMHNTVHAIDHRGVRDFFREHSGEVADAVHHHLRKLNRV